MTRDSWKMSLRMCKKRKVAKTARAFVIFTDNRCCCSSEASVVRSAGAGESSKWSKKKNFLASTRKQELQLKHYLFCFCSSSSPLPALLPRSLPTEAVPQWEPVEDPIPLHHQPSLHAQICSVRPAKALATPFTFLKKWKLSPPPFTFTEKDEAEQ